MAYEVVTPLVIVRDETGASHYLYTGAHVPDYVTADRVKELEAEGHIRKVGSTDEPKSEEEPKTPAKNAAKADWEAYARSQGAKDEDLDGLSKDDLISKYGA